MHDVTRILNQLPESGGESAESLLPVVYNELRRLAASKMAQERAGQTLQATALVHEAWLKIVKSNQKNWKNRNHFFATAAEAMRRILIDRARKRLTREKAGLSHREELDESGIALNAPPEEILSVHASLDALEVESKEAATLVKLRYFTGLTMLECAEIMELSLRNTERLWTFARSWLRTEIHSES